MTDEITQKSTIASSFRNRVRKLAVPTTGKNPNRFTIGNKKATGGKRQGAGRPTTKEADTKRQVLEQIRLESPDDLKELNALALNPLASLELRAKIRMWKLNKVVPDLEEHEHKGIPNLPDLILTAIEKAQNGQLSGNRLTGLN